MIPILYSSTATTFTNFGIGHLPDAISPHVIEERNGEFTLDLQYPVFGEHYDDIGLRSIILAKPSPDQDPQPFRVFKITKPINGVVSISARHVRYDMEGVPVSPFTASGIINALAAIKSHEMVASPFTFSTNKTNTQTMKLGSPASMLSLLGGTEGSLLDVYGGEYKYNGFEVNLLSSRGTNAGVVIRYGVDLIDLNQEENCANCYTGVLCYWRSVDGSQTVTGEIQSAGTFDYTRIKLVDRSTNYETAPSANQLNIDAVSYINSNQVGVPKVSLTLTFANLEQTEEFSNIRQSIKLCDSITVSFEKIGVNTMAKVIRTDYDVLNENYLSIDIGSARTSIAETIVGLNTKVENTPTTAEMQQAVTSATAAITGANGGAVRLLDTNGDDFPDTLYVADNADPLLASKVWRFNYEGWGASEHGYNGPFTMGATFAAGFIADFITAGTLNADRIGANSISVAKLTGKINGGNSWEIDLTNGTMTIGDISAANITAGTLSADRLAANSIAVSKLTGVISANGWKIDLDDGSLTIGNISANKINTGTLNANRLGANSISVSKLTGTITSGTGSDQWKIDLDNGTLTIGSISASKLTSGTIDAAEITVTHLNASNITVGTLNGDRLGTNSIAGSKLKDSTIEGDKIAPYTITGGYDGNLAPETVIGANVDSYTLTGGYNGNLAPSTVYVDSSFTNLASEANTGVLGGYNFAAMTNYPAYYAYPLNASSFRYNGSQLRPQDISFVDGNGNTRTFTGVLRYITE